eukprot:CAMPEP_0198290594 /NCGR_PEP_ID=MMETSP1449-20131203/8395_1 /TAXON_ID=420275 /ORGANISM="Attheya septentrionalis, Strain CCMP2084" /LENGTH=336 /DNA_ID=CAMNT_0043989109 /DNA_START=115 /DNA_END=1125 /DNA_ORIENTATION=-
MMEDLPGHMDGEDDYPLLLRQDDGVVPVVEEEEWCLLLGLPDVLLYHVLTFVSPPTERVVVLGLQLAPLSRSHWESIQTKRSGLWSTLLLEYQPPPPPVSSSSSSTPRRSSKRLRRAGKREVVRDAHLLLRDRTEIAHYAFTEMAHSKRTPLTLARLRWIFKEYGPNVRTNQCTFLVECCRARHISEQVILRCVKELIERHGAIPDHPTKPQDTCSFSNQTRPLTPFLISAGLGCSNVLKVPTVPIVGMGLTPLIVAAARGMPKVVAYLLQSAGAAPSVKGSGRFHLFSKRTKSIKLECSTALEFSLAMKEAELQHGLSPNDCKSLNKCIRLLQTT